MVPILTGPNIAVHKGMVLSEFLEYHLLKYSISRFLLSLVKFQDQNFLIRLTVCWNIFIISFCGAEDTWSSTL